MKEWVDLAEHGYDGYEVSRDGTVRRNTPARGTWVGRVAKPNVLPRSNLRRIQLNGANVMVHHLVLFAFVGPRPEGFECRHLDGDPSNNFVDNLRWGTHTENMEDRSKHGTLNVRGELNPNAKLTESDVREIRRRVASGETQHKVAGSFDVTPALISAIIRRVIWKHV